MNDTIVKLITDFNSEYGQQNFIPVSTVNDLLLDLMLATNDEDANKN